MKADACRVGRLPEFSNFTRIPLDVVWLVTTGRRKVRSHTAVARYGMAMIWASPWASEYQIAYYLMIQPI